MSADRRAVLPSSPGRKEGVGTTALHAGFDGYGWAASASCWQLHDYIFVGFLPHINSWIWQIRSSMHAAPHATRQIRHLKSEGDYSYAMKRLAEDRLLLIGDAACFIDPIFSSGVSIALNSERFAHGDIVRAMDTGDSQCEAFITSESSISRGTGNWYHFISRYYRLNVLFAAFIRGSATGSVCSKLLQGDMYHLC